MRRFRSRVGWAGPNCDPCALNGCTVLVGLVHSGKGFLGASHPGLHLFITFCAKVVERRSSMCRYRFFVMFMQLLAAGNKQSQASKVSSLARLGEPMDEIC